MSVLFMPRVDLFLQTNSAPNEKYSGITLLNNNYTFTPPPALSLLIDLNRLYSLRKVRGRQWIKELVKYNQAS